MLGLDGIYPKLKGKGRGVVVVVSMEEGIPLTILEVDEVLVTDDLGSYREGAEELGLEHQVCRFHLLRWTRRGIFPPKSPTAYVTVSLGHINLTF